MFIVSGKYFRGFASIGQKLLLLLMFSTIVADVSGKGRVRMKGEELIKTWLSAVDRVSPQDYIPIGSFQVLPESVRGDSSLWSERFFTENANPHLQKDAVKFSVHLSTPDTPDLLRFEYDCQGEHLTVIESNDFTLIFVVPSPASPQDIGSASYIQAEAKTILNLHSDDRTWSFNLPARIGNNELFSSNPTVDPLYLPDWRQRADGGVHNGKLFFILYKKEMQYAGYENIQKWFDQDFRSKLH